MWGDYPGYYAKYVIRQKRAHAAADRRNKKEQDARTAARYMRKVRAQIRTEDNISVESYPAWSPLSDINYRTAEFFVTDRLNPHDELSLILEYRDTIYLKAKVLRCHEYETTNRVISQQKFKYRVTLAFLYESPDEQTLFQDYLTLAAA